MERVQVKFIKIADINEGQRFRKDMGDMTSLVESIKEKGIIQPITLGDDKGTLKLMAGKRRLTAAREAGLTTIPALVRPYQDEVDLREIELIENIAREDFTWAERCALVAEIDRLYHSKHLDWSGRKTAQLLNRGTSSVGRDLKLASAITRIPELAEVKTADDALKVVAQMEEKEIVTELRSRQQSPGMDKGISAMLDMADGNYCIGDTFKGLAELRSDGVIHIIECDPPYGIDLTEVRRGAKEVTSTVQSYNEVDSLRYEGFLSDLCRELYRVAAPNAWLIFWFGPTWHTEVRSNLRKAGWLVDDIPCIWAKSAGQTNAPEFYLARCYEPFFLCRKGKPVLVKRGRSNIFSFPGETGPGKYHPTQRPLALMEELLRTLGVDLQTVLVPFLGSGVTLRAAYNSGMRAFGWDLNGEYKDKFMLAIEEDARGLTEQIPFSPTNTPKPTGVRPPLDVK